MPLAICDECDRLFVQGRTSTVLADCGRCGSRLRALTRAEIKTLVQSYPEDRHRSPDSHRLRLPHDG